MATTKPAYTAAEVEQLLAIAKGSIVKLERRAATLAEAVRRLHEQAESAAFGWRGALPPEDATESTQTRSDRLAILDLLRKIDQIKAEADRA